VCRGTLQRWVKAYIAHLPLLVDTLLPMQTGDVLESHEVWSLVGSKEQECGLWTAVCRRTRPVVAFFIGDRSAFSCQQLWQRVPAA
jgi:hypothetical protein